MQGTDQRDWCFPMGQAQICLEVEEDTLSATKRGLACTLNSFQCQHILSNTKRKAMKIMTAEVVELPSNILNLDQLAPCFLLS